MSCYLAVIYVNLTGKSQPVDLVNKPLLLLVYIILMFEELNCFGVNPFFPGNFHVQRLKSWYLCDGHGRLSE